MNIEGLLSEKHMVSYDTGKFRFLSNARRDVIYDVKLLQIIVHVHKGQKTVIF